MMTGPSSKTVKATHFKFDVRLPRDSSDMTLKNFQKGACPGSRDPKNSLGFNGSIRLASINNKIYRNKEK